MTDVHGCPVLGRAKLAPRRQPVQRGILWSVTETSGSDPKSAPLPVSAEPDGYGVALSDGEGLLHDAAQVDDGLTESSDIRSRHEQ
jgi:hypothetical protein